MSCNITRVKTNTTVQTVLLGLALAGVAVLTGWQLVGSWALLLLAGFLVSVALSVHRTNPRIVLQGARPIRYFEAPLLFDAVERLSRRAGLREPPELHYVRSRVMNAATIGDPDHAVLLVTDGILSALDRRELEGVLAHEIAHIRNRDLSLFRFAEILRQATLVFVRAGWSLVLFALPVLIVSGGLSGGALLTLLLAPLASSLLQRALLRTREFAADATAAELTGHPLGLARALGLIDYAQRSLLEMILPVQPDNEGSLFRTHPGTSERISRLREMARRSAPRARDPFTGMRSTGRSAGRAAGAHLADAPQRKTLISS